MKKKMQVLFFLALSNVLWAALPMENIGRYNVVLVHGAADRWGGMDCENGERATGTYYKEAYENRQGVVTDQSSCHLDSSEVPDIDHPGVMRDSVFTRCDTAYYVPSRIGGIKHGKNISSAVGMVKEVEQLLRESIFDTPEATFLQRPFVHPAGSPALNGNEIGQSNWKGLQHPVLPFFLVILSKAKDPVKSRYDINRFLYKFILEKFKHRRNSYGKENCQFWI